MPPKKLLHKKSGSPTKRPGTRVPKAVRDCQRVTWKMGKGQREFRSIHDIGSVGWVNEELELGTLERKKQEKGRVTFEFLSKENKRFDAWTTTTPKNAATVAKLKENHEYVIKGTIQAKTRRKIDVVREREARNEQGPSSSRNSTLVELNRKVEAEQYFSADVKNIKIERGEIYRYLNKINKHGLKTGQICMIIRNLTVSDETGKTSRLVMFHTDVAKLLGEGATKKVCDAFSDSHALKEFKKLKGATINGTIAHQRPTSSKRKDYNTSKLILRNVALVSSRHHNEHMPMDEDDFDPAAVSTNTVEDAQTTITGFMCEQCDGGGSDSDEEDGEPSSFSSPFSRDLEYKFELNTEASYPIYKAKTQKYVLAMIINIDSDINQSRRKGSQADIANLERAFPKLDIAIFRGKAIKNPTKKGFEKHLADFKQELIDQDYCSFILVYMGHGTQNHVKLADGTRLHVLRDIMLKFNEIEFPQFAEKPKVFIYQACSSFEKHCDVKEEHSAFVDALWVIPTLPGQRAKRNNKTGSYFIQALTASLEEFKYSDFASIMYEVQKRLKNAPRKDNNYYIPTVMSRCFKKFYFAKREIIF